MSLTIRQLVDNPSLRTRIVAGSSGEDKLVLWAEPLPRVFLPAHLTRHRRPN